MGEEENSEGVATISRVHVLLQKSASKVVLGGGLSREKEGWMRAPTHKTCNNTLLGQ